MHPVKIRLRFPLLSAGSAAFWLFFTASCLAAEATAIQIYYSQPKDARDQFYIDSSHRVAAEWSRKTRQTLTEKTLAGVEEEQLESLLPDDASANVVFVHPANPAAIVRLAEKRPNMHITIIDAPATAPVKNIRSVVFSDHEGAFLIGMISALTTQTSTVGFIGGEDTPMNRHIASGFVQGVKFVNGTVNVQTDMAGASMNSAELFEKQGTANADEIFLTGLDGLDRIYAAAKQYRRRLVLLDPGSAAQSSPWQLTSMTRRLDLALRDTLHDIEQGRWKAGAVNLGIREGYIDYVIDQENKAMLSREVIERVEIAKDLIIRGVMSVKP